MQLSCAIGNALYPDRQWTELADLWSELYPRRNAPAAMHRPLALLEAQIPPFVQFMLEHRPPALRGARLGDALGTAGPEQGGAARALLVLARLPRGVRPTPRPRWPSPSSGRPGPPA